MALSLTVDINDPRISGLARYVNRGNMENAYVGFNIAGPELR